MSDKPKQKNAAKPASETPLMRQYYSLKQKYPDAILLFRVGDFYETFGEDAIVSAQILGITLTKRANGSASHIELAGFPYHALDVYLPKFVRAGKRVAICEQLEDPKQTKTIVKRGVTELITPGTSLHDKTLDVNANNFLAAVHFGNPYCGLALCDLTTGEFMVSQGPISFVDKIIQAFKPSEILHAKPKQDAFKEAFGTKLYTYFLDEWLFNSDYAQEKLTAHFKTQNLKVFGVADFTDGLVAAGVILHYLNENKFEHLGHITAIKRLEPNDAVWLDKFTIRNLELVRAQQDDGTALINVLDKTLTPMGGRLLKNWILLPLIDVKAIRKRQDLVTFFTQNFELSEAIATELKQIGDIERLISKVALQRVNPREVRQINRALLAIGRVKELLNSANNEVFEPLISALNDCKAISRRIDDVLEEDPPVQIGKGNLIKTGFYEQLDEYRKLAGTGKEYLVELQKAEMQKTGISALKIGFNNVFGYYLEVRNSNKNKVPENWVRKQTLVSAERYITPELKEYEEKILSAEEKMLQMEQEIYQELVAELYEYIQPIQQNANTIARLDVLHSLALVAVKYKYCKPEINQSKQIIIKDGRHPVIERTLPIEEEYIPNDILLDNDAQQIVILTGPNMSGKSAVLRQTALVVLMAQIGSYVPASEAIIGWVDKIFTRVGASDNLSTGESTFMVEMTETASILNNFSERSLILLDEIGRGTSTYDGVSIAWSISEYLHDHPFRPKTIFATHYHELNEIASKRERVKNYHVSVRELKDKIIFMRKLTTGGSEHSFGIHVAQMAGVPLTVVNRAQNILYLLEDKQDNIQQKDKLAHATAAPVQLNMFGVDDPIAKKLKQELSTLDINAITPMESLMKLNYLKGLLKE